MGEGPEPGLSVTAFQLLANILSLPLFQRRILWTGQKSEKLLYHLSLGNIINHSLLDWPDF